MSVLIQREAACTYCKHPNQAEVWSIINVRQDPELKDILIGGELNMAECEACRRIFHIETFLLYHDPDRELMAFVYPYEGRRNAAEWEAKTKADFDASQGTLDAAERLTYEPVSVFGLDELLHIVEREDEAEIQGEIVEALAPENAFNLIKLRPARARLAGVPRVLPTLNGGTVDAVIAGIDRVLQVNDRLSAYVEARADLAKKPTGFTLE